MTGKNGSAVTLHELDEHLVNSTLKAPLAIAQFFTDGTLVYVNDKGYKKVGVELREGLAKPYQEQFADSPPFVGAINAAFQGNVVSDTVRLKDQTIDIRVFPAASESQQGVIAILTDASDRMTALRSVKTLNVLAKIRKGLAISDTPVEFLSRVAAVLEELYPMLWMALADSNDGKRLQMVVPENASKVFLDHELSWDINQKTGRHLAGEAVRTARTQVAHDIASHPECSVWSDVARKHDLRSAVCVPFMRDGRSLGVMCIYAHNDTVADKEVLALWEQIAAEITDGIALLDQKEERKRMAGERQEVSGQYKQLVNSIFDVIIIHQNGRIVDINPSGVALTGASSREQLIGTPLAALMDPSERARLLKEFARETPSPEVLEWRLLSLDGRVLDVEGVTAPIQFDGSAAQLSVLRDISQRKLNDLAVTKAKTNLEYAQQIAQMGSVDLDVTTGVADWSRNALAILDIADTESTSGFIDALAAKLDEAQVAAIRELTDDIARTRNPLSRVITIKQAASDGPGFKTIRLFGIPEVERRVFVPRIFFVVQDVSEQSATERERDYLVSRLQRSEALALVAEVELVPETQKAHLDSTALSLLGLELPQTALSVDAFVGLIRSEDRAGFREVIENALIQFADASSREVSLGECDCGLQGKGHLRWIRFRFVKATVGETARLLCQLRDVTDERRLKADITAKEKTLKLYRRMAGLVEWYYDRESERINFSENVVDFLGYEPPVKFLTYQQFFQDIRPEDRDNIKEAVNTSLKTGADGDMVFIESFGNGDKRRMYGRWTCDVRDGKVVGLKGISMNISHVRDSHQRESIKANMHTPSGAAQTEMIYDRLLYLSSCADAESPFSVISFRVQPYREIKRRMGEEAFYARQSELHRLLSKSIDRLDTVGRLDKGMFVLIVRRAVEEEERVRIEQFIHEWWVQTLTERNCAPDEPIESESFMVRSPEDGIEWQGLLKLLEHRSGLKDGGAHGSAQ